MLAIAGGILIAFFVLVFIEPILELVVWLFIIAFWLAVCAVFIGIFLSIMGL